MPHYCQTLALVYAELLSCMQYLENLNENDKSPPQQIFQRATNEYLQHIREQFMIHDSYCCSCNNQV